MYVKGWQIASKIEEIAPKKYAIDNDNNGLQLGCLNNEIKKCLLTLDVTNAVLEEAIDKGVELIISHHPLFFESVNKIVKESDLGNLITRAIKNEINIYSAHTNLDAAPVVGVNSILADKLDLQETRVLYPTYEEKYYKIVVFVPVGYENDVKEAIFSAGGGWIGNYSHTAFYSEGKGSFKPLDGTSPFLGTRGEVSEVKEMRVETMVTRDHIEPVLESIKQTHPYEEVAYDLYLLSNQMRIFGLGLVGSVKSKVKTEDFIENVKEVLNVKNIRVIGENPELITKVALCGGSGERLISKARKEGADVYITGDIKYHAALDAADKNMLILDAGHYPTELPLLEALKGYLEDTLGSETETGFYIATEQKNPYMYY